MRYVITILINYFKYNLREMDTLSTNPVSSKETELNNVLSDHQKHCLLPDMVLECINKRVRVTPFHGPKKFISEPLLRQRMFIVHDNVEVLLKDCDSSKYSTIGEPVHMAVIELAKNKGKY